MAWVRGGGLALGVASERGEELGNAEVALRGRRQEVIFGVLNMETVSDGTDTNSTCQTHKVCVEVRVEHVLGLTWRQVSSYILAGGG